jgi:hypothetical protein
MWAPPSVQKSSFAQQVDQRARGTLSASLFHVLLSGRCCTHHRIGVVIDLEGGELAVSAPEDEREITVVDPAERMEGSVHYRDSNIR